MANWPACMYGARTHHAIQIVISLDLPVGIAGKGEEWRFGRGIVVNEPAARVPQRETIVLQWIRRSDDLRISLESAAAVSPLCALAQTDSRRGGHRPRRSLTAAAQAGDFADAAHLTRTFQQMFGLPPSVMMRGDFFVIASPFEASAASEA